MAFRDGRAATATRSIGRRNMRPSERTPALRAHPRLRPKTISVQLKPAEIQRSDVHPLSSLIR
jgi:hypothetical protein